MSELRAHFPNVSFSNYSATEMRIQPMIPIWSVHVDIEKDANETCEMSALRTQFPNVSFVNYSATEM